MSSLLLIITGLFAATQNTPNDPLYSQQWHLTAIGIPQLWQHTQGEGIIIALLDSGVDPNHPDLSANILFDKGYDFGDDDSQPFDENGHGTAMAGLAVATCGNQKGICGVAPATKLIPYKINAKGKDSFLATDLADAILAAADSSAQIISLSLYLQEEISEVQTALTYAKNQGKIIVAAAGNQNSTVAYPAYLPWIIGVGATDKQGKRLHTSNYGNGLTLMAPGTDLPTTLPGSGYTKGYDGTSAATAIVSGVIALILAQQATPNPLPTITQLLNATQDVDLPGFDDNYGFGILQAPLPTTEPIPIAEPSLAWQLHSETVLTIENRLQLNLTLNQVKDKQGDLYLRINFPRNKPTRRDNIFKVWQENDHQEPIPYNYHLATPYSFTNDVILNLYGEQAALLGDGEILSSFPDGSYEFLAGLVIDNKLILARKIIWIATGKE